MNTKQVNYKGQICAYLDSNKLLKDLIFKDYIDIFISKIYSGMTKDEIVTLVNASI